MSAVTLLRRPSIIVFALVCLVATLFALYTNHVWEDYYITYRSSKNFATGNGLVHNVGQRLHAFTSPLGVLLPAAASLATLNSSDTAALWIFRAFAIAALGTAAVLLYWSTRRLELPLIASLFLVVCLATDAKTVDFTINGMETPFVLAFFAYAFWAMYAVESKRWIHLGLAWGGLMWCRPDGCVTIGLLTTAVWLFNDPARTGLSRREWLPVFLRAAGVATGGISPMVSVRVDVLRFASAPHDHGQSIAGRPKVARGILDLTLEFHARHQLSLWRNRLHVLATLFGFRRMA